MPPLHKRRIMRECQHSQQLCPISKSACPGVCVYADIFETIQIGIGVCNTESKTIVFTNRLFSELFGGSIAPNDYDVLSRVLIKEKQPRNYQSGYPNAADQVHLNGRILGYTVYRAAKNFIWIFVRDITEKIRLESVAEAVNTSSNIGYIFSGVRHEIGNPINSIKVALSVLRDHIDDYSRETVIKYIDRTLDDIGRVEYLLQTLKNFNMYETQVKEVFDLSVFMVKFLSLISDDFKNSGIDIQYTHRPGTVPVRADLRALQQVLLNIVTNAADALNGCDDPFIRISVNSFADMVQITVQDNGSGIREDQKHELFKPFFTSKPNGTGLGLVISRKMLAQMGGMIHIESSENRGTTVMITLPRRSEGE